MVLEYGLRHSGFIQFILEAPISNDSVYRFQIHTRLVFFGRCDLLPHWSFTGVIMANREPVKREALHQHHFFLNQEMVSLRRHFVSLSFFHTRYERMSDTKWRPNAVYLHEQLKFVHRTGNNRTPTLINFSLQPCDLISLTF